jgi:hypothetical protein
LTKSPTDQQRDHQQEDLQERVGASNSGGKQRTNRRGVDQETIKDWACDSSRAKAGSVLAPKLETARAVQDGEVAEEPDKHEEGKARTGRTGHPQRWSAQ